MPLCLRPREGDPDDAYPIRLGVHRSPYGHRPGDHPGQHRDSTVRRGTPRRRCQRLSSGDVVRRMTSRTVVARMSPRLTGPGACQPPSPGNGRVEAPVSWTGTSAARSATGVSAPWAAQPSDSVTRRTYVQTLGHSAGCANDAARGRTVSTARVVPKMQTPHRSYSMRRQATRSVSEHPC